MAMNLENHDLEYYIEKKLSFNSKDYLSNLISLPDK